MLPACRASGGRVPVSRFCGFSWPELSRTPQDTDLVRSAHLNKGKRRLSQPSTLLERMFVQCVLRSSKRPGARTSQTEPLRRRPALRATTTSPDIQPSL